MAVADNRSTSEIGASGLNYGASGEILEELNPRLQGRKAIETFRLMKDNDAVVGSILYAIEMLLRRVEWTVEQQEAEEEDRDFLMECMELSLIHI